MGKLFLITGPSGAGKREVIDRINQFGIKFEKVTSYTTREKREGEVEGESYNYISKKDFDGMVKEDEMLEWAEVHKNLYGTKEEEVDKYLKENERVLIEIDPSGARKVKEKRPDAVSIFIMPPSYEGLKTRLASLSEGELEARIKIGKKELEKLLDWDYLVVYEEGKLDQVAEDVSRILKENT